MKQDSIIKNKPLLTQSRLFLEVSGVIGKVAALEELTLAYREYKYWKDKEDFDWSVTLLDSFIWEGTPQGFEYWDKIRTEIVRRAPF